MSRVEEKVFTDKLAALRYNRERSAQFFAATIPAGEAKEIYVVAVSLHRAQMALVNYLMGPVKWNKKEQDSEYIKALEAEAAKKLDADKV